MVYITEPLEGSLLVVSSDPALTGIHFRYVIHGSQLGR